MYRCMYIIYIYTLLQLRSYPISLGPGLSPHRSSSTLRGFSPTTRQSANGADSVGEHHDGDGKPKCSARDIAVESAGKKSRRFSVMGWTAVRWCDSIYLMHAMNVKHIYMAGSTYILYCRRHAARRFVTEGVTAVVGITAAIHTFIIIIIILRTYGYCAHCSATTVSFVLFKYS